LYFGYGSNLWHKQMAQRCPGAEFLGIARLRAYQWMINKRGYATIAKVDDPSDPGSDSGGGDEVEVEIENVNHKNTVWGAVWSLTPDDEAALDKDEGVPFGYANKKYNSNKKKEKEKYKYKRLGKPEMVSMLVYIDFRHNRPGAAAKGEYHHRMQMAIWDALEVGIPSSYVKCVLSKWIEPGGSKN
ncbi:gamma-glutamylcyclotransferase, partial [Rhypophila decipiens]